MHAPRPVASRIRPLLALALVPFLAAGCSKAVEQGATGDEQGTVTEPPTPIDELTVDTGVSDDGPSAGQQIQVFCSVGGLADAQEPPATSWEILQMPVGLLHDPIIEGNKITFLSAGTYQLRCQIDETGYVDPEPARVQVIPGEAIELDTTVDPTLLRAGDKAQVTCFGRDAYDNEIVDDFDVIVRPAGQSPGPAEGLVHANFALKALVVGTYDVACHRRGGNTDATPARVTVEPGLPYRLVTTLDEDSIVAGFSTRVSCRAEDRLGNEVPTLPMAVSLPDSLALTGLEVGGTVAGKFVVKCVPQALDWDAFVLDHALLEVVPDVPIGLTLEVQPPKPVFRRMEIVNLVAKAWDQYDNIIPDVVLAPIEVDPDLDYKRKTDMSFQFKVEGYWTLTARVEDNPGLSDSVEVAIAGLPPGIVVETPERGATIQGLKPSVTVAGLAGGGVANVTEVTVNGKKASLATDEEGNQTFSTVMVPRWGLNVIVVEAIDEVGEITRVTQSYYFAEQYYPIEPEAPIIPDAIKAWLREDFIDDGVHNPTHPDDLATILENVIAGFDLSGALGAGTPVGAGYELKINSVTFNPPKLTLDSIHGGLQLGVEIKNLLVRIRLEGECKVLGIDLCPDFGGSFGVARTTLDATLFVGAEQGVLNVSMANPQVGLEGIDVEIDGILGWLFDWLIDFVVNIFADTIADMFEDQLSGMLEDTLADLLTSLVISETIDVPPIFPGMEPLSVTLDSRIWTLRFTPDGGRMGLGARILTPKRVSRDILGTIARGTCLKGYQVNWQLPGGAEFEAGLFDDFLNQAFTAIWQAGIMNLDLDQEAIGELGGGDGGGLDLGGLPVDSIDLRTDFLLPPILNGCDPSGIMRIQIGDVFIDAELESGLFFQDDGVGKIGLYAAIEISAELTLSETPEGTAIGLVLHGIDRMDFHWEYVPSLFVGAEEDLEDLIKDQLFGALLDGLGEGSLFEFVIPELDLGTLAPEFGEGILIAPAIEELKREGGHTLLQGYLE